MSINALLKYKKRTKLGHPTSSIVFRYNKKGREMVLVHFLICFTLIFSAFLTCICIIEIVGGYFGFHMVLNWSIFEDEYWEEKILRRSVKKQTQPDITEKEKMLKVKSNVSKSNGSRNKFDIDIDDPQTIIKPITGKGGVDIDCLIAEGANIELDELNAKLQMLEIED